MASEPSLIRCPACGNTLGAWVAGQAFVRHGRREVVGFPTSIKCEDCGALWINPALAVPGTA